MNEYLSYRSTWEAFEQVFVLLDCPKIFLGNDTVLHCFFAFFNIKVLFIIAIFIFLWYERWLDTIAK